MLFLLKYILNISFFKVCLKRYFVNDSVLPFILTSLIFFSAFILLFYFLYMLFKKLFYFFKDFINFGYIFVGLIHIIFLRFFSNFFFVFFLFLYRIRFFFLFGASYFDSIPKIFYDRFFGVKGEFLMNFYNFTHKFIFYDDFNSPLSIFTNDYIVDASKNFHLSKKLYNHFIDILLVQNKLRSFFFSKI